MFFAISPLNNQPEKSVKQLGLNNKDILLYLEAVTRIQDNALFLDSNITRDEIIQGTLKSYLVEKDTFSEYLTREEYLGFKEFQDEKYVGIGMEILRNRKGEVVCIPYPGSTAEKAGIKVGDRLIDINGISVYGKSLFAIASMARGKSETKININILTRNGIEKHINMMRSDLKINNVSKRFFGTIPVIKIITFTRNTKEDLKTALSNLEKNKPIVIDLRSNPGGDLHEAIDSAMLFLEVGKKIVAVKTRTEFKIYESSNNILTLPDSIYLWQDEATASASEVFIAALTENNRAISIGKKTFGKGTKQDVIELNDGSALVLTTGYLQTPNGTDYHGHGLTPAYALKEDLPETASYLAKVKELIGSSMNNVTANSSNDPGEERNY